MSMYWQGQPAAGQTPNRNSPILQQNPNNSYQIQDTNNISMTPIILPTTQGGQVQPLPIQTSSQVQQQSNKDVQAAALCRYGQETVQEIVSRTQDVFQTLRSTQPPDGKSSVGAERNKTKVQETLKNIRTMFKRLRAIYEKIEEMCGTTIDADNELQNKIPFKDDADEIDEKRNTEAYLAAQEEYNELVEQTVKKNAQLRETIDQLRLIIWDVNTMLAMRKE